ncbi:hypothetical protein [Luteibacter rhizovicinus]|uniref:hypothetical protein n=1 Tax=Luteibacter rhizovicinus TaxID=242606 RepID=UPI001051D296|nr:hypothetical protein [Luteibacter rhizovicinus]
MDYPKLCEVPLTNAGFDTGDLMGWEPTPTFDSAGNVVPSHPRVSMMDGQSVLELPSTSDGARQRIPLPDLSMQGMNDSALILRFRIRATKEESDALSIGVIRDYEGSGGIYFQYDLVDAGPRWKEVYVPFSALDADGYRRLTLQMINSSDDTNRIYVDDIAVIQETGTVPLM